MKSVESGFSFVGRLLILDLTSLKNIGELGVIAHIYNLRRQRLRGLRFETSPSKKLVRFHLNKQAGCGGASL
jgi:hypothetical protein